MPPKMAGRRRVSLAQDPAYTTSSIDLVWQTSRKAQESDSEPVQIFEFLDLPSGVRNLIYPFAHKSRSQAQIWPNILADEVKQEAHIRMEARRTLVSRRSCSS